MICTKCGQDKNISEFHKRSESPTGYRHQCKKCLNQLKKEWADKNPDFQLKRKIYTSRPEVKQRKAEVSRNSHLSKNYNLNIEQYNIKLSNQDNKCAICKQQTTKTLCVDHNHTTGQIRDLLCDSCNQAIGFFKEDINNLKSAIEYLEKWSNNDGKS